MDGRESANSLDLFFDPESGGYAYSLDAATGEFDYIHAEITGFALSLLARGNGKRIDARGVAGGDPIADPGSDTDDEAGGLDRESPSIHRIAQFLLDLQTPEGGFRHSARSHPAFPVRSHEVHIFDTAVCASALLDYSERMGNGGHRRSAERAADWLVAEARHPEGGFRAVWLDDRREWGDSRRAGFWSTEGGCYHGRILALFSRLNRWTDAERLLHWMLATQRRDGSWPASLTQPRVHTHAMCYALEGLLHFHLTTRDPSAHDAAHRGMVWLSEQATRHDGIPAWIPDEQPEYRSDTQIQFLRLASTMENPPSFREAGAACRRRLERLRAREGQWLVGDGASPSISSRVAAWTTLFHLASRLPGATAAERLL